MSQNIAHGLINKSKLIHNSLCLCLSSYTFTETEQNNQKLQTNK